MCSIYNDQSGGSQTRDKTASMSTMLIHHNSTTSKTCILLIKNKQLGMLELRLLKKKILIKQWNDNV